VAAQPIGMRGSSFRRRHSLPRRFSSKNSLQEHINGRARGTSKGDTHGLSSKDDGTFSDSDDGRGPSGPDMFQGYGNGDHWSLLGRYRWFNRQAGGGLNASVVVAEIVTLSAFGSLAELKVERRGLACEQKQRAVVQLQWATLHKIQDKAKCSFGLLSSRACCPIFLHFLADEATGERFELGAHFSGRDLQMAWRCGQNFGAQKN
jgi:hypothetical protein